MLKKLPIWYIITSALAILGFLFYLGYRDEGYNNWSWMQDAGSWIFMFIAWNFLFWTMIGLGIIAKMTFKSNSHQNNQPPTS